MEIAENINAELVLVVGVTGDQYFSFRFSSGVDPRHSIRKLTVKGFLFHIKSNHLSR